MAAATINSEIFTVQGDKQVVLANLTIADTNTYDIPGITNVEDLQMTGNDSSALYGSAAIAVSAGVATATFKVSGSGTFWVKITGN